MPRCHICHRANQATLTAELIGICGISTKAYPGVLQAIERSHAGVPPVIAAFAISVALAQIHRTRRVSELLPAGVIDLRRHVIEYSCLVKKDSSWRKSNPGTRFCQHSYGYHSAK